MVRASDNGREMSGMIQAEKYFAGRIFIFGGYNKIEESAGGRFKTDGVFRQKY